MKDLKKESILFNAMSIEDKRLSRDECTSDIADLIKKYEVLLRSGMDSLDPFLDEDAKYTVYVAALKDLEEIALADEKAKAQSPALTLKNKR